jgi:hypothetical protein
LIDVDGSAIRLPAVDPSEGRERDAPVRRFGHLTFHARIRGGA